MFNNVMEWRLFIMKNNISFLYILIKKINSLIDKYVFINHIHLGSRCHGTIPLIIKQKEEKFKRSHHSNFTEK